MITVVTKRNETFIQLDDSRVITIHDTTSPPFYFEGNFYRSHYDVEAARHNLFAIPNRDSLLTLDDQHTLQQYKDSVAQRKSISSKVSKGVQSDMKNQMEGSMELSFKRMGYLYGLGSMALDMPVWMDGYVDLQVTSPQTVFTFHNEILMSALRDTYDSIVEMEGYYNSVINDLWEGRMLPTASNYRLMGKYVNLHNFILHKVPRIGAFVVPRRPRDLKAATRDMLSKYRRVLCYITRLCSQVNGFFNTYDPKITSSISLGVLISGSEYEKTALFNKHNKDFYWKKVYSFYFKGIPTEFAYRSLTDPPRVNYHDGPSLIKFVKVPPVPLNKPYQPGYDYVIPDSPATRSAKIDLWAASYTGCYTLDTLPPQPYSYMRTQYQYLAPAVTFNEPIRFSTNQPQLHLVASASSNEQDSTDYADRSSSQDSEYGSVETDGNVGHNNHVEEGEANGNAEESEEVNFDNLHNVGEDEDFEEEGDDEAIGQGEGDEYANDDYDDDATLVGDDDEYGGALERARLLFEEFANEDNLFTQNYRLLREIGEDRFSLHFEDGEEDEEEDGGQEVQEEDDDDDIYVRLPVAPNSSLPRRRLRITYR